MSEAPLRELTFVLTDIEGSTAIWDRDRTTASAAVARHDDIVSQQVAARGGTVVESRGEGDGAFLVFDDPAAAVAAALDITRSLAAEPWPEGAAIRVRVGIHGGIVEERNGHLYGSAINRCARLRAIAHGGQIVLSAAVAAGVRDALPRGASLRDLGVHGLRGLRRPERVFQLEHPDIEADFPPLASEDALRHNIPASLTSFIGRASEIETLVSAVGRDRLTTLIGVGGAGKTRLALEVAAAVVDRFDDGVWFVELGPIHDGRLVPSTVAATLRIREEHQRDVAATLEDRLRSRRLLLVFDSCEHVVGSVAALVSRLLAACPDLLILATSRETLALIGERTHVVEPLPAPLPSNIASIDSGLGHDAVRLFVERARSRRPGFELDLSTVREIAEVCRRLDGIPLAIELAANRAATLGVGEVATRLSDRFAVLTGGERGSRRETLLATLDWSYELLAEPERELYASLAVFPGRFTLEDVELVCGARDALDVVPRLIDRSLISSMDGSLRLLETIRAHALTKLVPDALLLLRERHLARFLDRAEIAVSALPVGRSDWLAKLDADRDNIRAAQAWSLRREPRGDAALRLAGALWRFWSWRGYHADDRAWTEQALLERPNPPTSAVAAALTAAGVLATEQGDLDVGAARLSEALEIRRALGEAEEEAWLLNGVGVVHEARGDHDAAIGFYERSLEAHRSLANALGEAVALGNLGVALGRTGAHASARELLVRCVALSREHGHEGSVAGATVGLGHVALARGDTQEAETLFRDVLRMEVERGAYSTIAPSFDGLAGAALASGDPVRAIALLRAADQLRDSTGVAPTQPERLIRDLVRAQANSSLDGTVPVSAWETGEFELERVISYALGEER